MNRRYGSGYAQLSTKFEKCGNGIRNSSALTKSASAIMTVTATTRTHPEKMGMVILWNLCIAIRNLNVLRKLLILTPARWKLPTKNSNIN
jgi:hypothetical protein